MTSLRIGKHRIVKNIASLRKVNIAHPYHQLLPLSSQLMSQVPHPHILPLLQQIALPYRRLSWVAYCHQRLILANCRIFICLNLTKYWQALPKLPRSCLNQKGERMSVGVAGCRFGYFDQRIKLKPVISFSGAIHVKPANVVSAGAAKIQDSSMAAGWDQPACSTSTKASTFHHSESTKILAP